MVQNPEKTADGIRTQGGSYLVNRKHIIIRKPSETCVADIQERAVAAGQILNGRNIALYGMAALTDDPEDPARQHLAPNATLINEGIIEIYLDEMVKAYKDQIQKNMEDTSRLYRFVKCFAMAAGKNSMVINEGIIRIHFDQEGDTPVYGETLLCGEQSTIINNGTIELTGRGTFATQARAIAVPADNVTIINNGSIKVDIDQSSTVRVLATTGKGGAILNFGDIDVTSSGRLMTIGRFADTQVLNAGTVNIDFKAHFIEQKVSFLFQSYPLACGIYEHCMPNENLLPPLVNSGTINVKIEGSEHSTDRAVAFGIYSEMVGEEKQIHKFENPGEIHVTSSGPYALLTAELGCNVQSAKDCPYDIRIGEWNTTARDFAKTRDLIVCKSGRVDLSDAVFRVDGNACTFRAEELVTQTDEGKEEGNTFIIKESVKKC